MASPENASRWYEGITRYQWLVLVIASLGWVFDVFEGQIFVASMNEAMPALLDESQRGSVAYYNNITFGAFLLGGRAGRRAVRRAQRPDRPQEDDDVHDRHVLGLHLLLGLFPAVVAPGRPAVPGGDGRRRRMGRGQRPGRGSLPQAGAGLVAGDLPCLQRAGHLHGGGGRATSSSATRTWGRTPGGGASPWAPCRPC